MGHRPGLPGAGPACRQGALAAAESLIGPARRTFWRNLARADILPEAHSQIRAAITGRLIALPCLGASLMFLSTRFASKLLRSRNVTTPAGCGRVHSAGTGILLASDFNDCFAAVNLKHSIAGLCAFRPDAVFMVYVGFRHNPAVRVCSPYQTPAGLAM